jgi:hypothetical protein
MHVHWQEIQIVDERREDEATRNAGDSVARYEEQTASYCL